MPDYLNANKEKGISNDQFPHVKQGAINSILRMINLSLNNSSSTNESNINIDSLNSLMAFNSEFDWKQLLRQALANGITSTAELTHKIYKKLSVIAQDYPSSVGYINAIVDEFRGIAEETFDTNPQTLEWEDLFGIWLFELGDYPKNNGTDTISFDDNAITSQSLQQQDGVNEARQLALDKISNNDLNNPTVSHPWTYGQAGFYDGMTDGNIATSFLGSYGTNIVIIQNPDGSHTLIFTVTNPSTWGSATRLRIDNDGDGNHDGIFPNTIRGDGNDEGNTDINIGGTINQICIWSETI
mgnify:CR=1 FL=1